MNEDALTVLMITEWPLVAVSLIDVIIASSFKIVIPVRGVE